jgi:uncharacterized protein (DUF1684 family)
MSLTGDVLALAHWRRTVAEQYAIVRQSIDVELAWNQFLNQRNALFKSHPQSPLDEVQRASFTRLDYFPYDASFRVQGRLDRNVAQESQQVQLAADGVFRYTRVARVCFTMHTFQVELSLFWVEGYGGGLFLPFKDRTNGHDTFGGGRYLYDTIKGADLGADTDHIILDFNFAYNPSCAYNTHWVCPLSPPENSLPFAITAGEKRFS